MSPKMGNMLKDVQNLWNDSIVSESVWDSQVELSVTEYVCLFVNSQVFELLTQLKMLMVVVGRGVIYLEG